MAEPDLQAAVESFVDEVVAFDEFGAPTRCDSVTLPGTAGLLPDSIPLLENEFWTSKQRQASSLHEVSYRACFKPQLPRFFIDRLTRPGDRVLDPFLGRGTTAVEAALRGRVAVGRDVSPISEALTLPRLHPPEWTAIEVRLEKLDLRFGGALPEELLVFYHPDTLRELCALRAYFLQRVRDGELDRVDAWLRMVATNRLTGHSSGFFSVYTLPPNQAVTVERQAIINEKRDQVPPRRDVRAILAKKSRTLLVGLTDDERVALNANRARHRISVGDSGDLDSVGRRSISLCVTSPPFLDVVDYRGDNWLRCWFLGIDPDSVSISILRKLPDWTAEMTRILSAVKPTLKRGGFVAFEVGEVRGGSVRLEEHAALAGRRAGLEAQAVLINRQNFTKTANCWGVSNNDRGTNSNRIVLLTRPD
ncbi:MAG: DNA methyltransferase [Planctomycetota bacterium]